MRTELKSIVIALSVYAVVWTPIAWSQDTGAVLRNMEQNQPQFRPIDTLRPLESVPFDPSIEKNVDRLLRVEVKSNLFKNEILTYWHYLLEKPVSAKQISEFKTWLWLKYQQEGFLPYILVTEVKAQQGSTLVVQIIQPVVNNIHIQSASGFLAERYRQEILRRFSEMQIAGSSIDIALIEAQINAVNLDIPVDIEIELKQVSDTKIDIILSVKDRESTVGKYLGGLFQINNYGLPQYGRMQGTANFRFGGLTQGSIIDFTTQQSTGAGYYRAEYQAPISGLNLRWNAWISSLDTKNRIESGRSVEGGLTLIKLLGYDRQQSTSGSLGVVTRRTINEIAGFTTSDRRDQQLRLNVLTTSDSHRSDRFITNLGLVAGKLDRSGNDFDIYTDNIGYQSQGTYQIATFSGQYALPVSDDRTLTASIRLRGQLASKNLDSYNKIALGGVNGIRAYSTQDGVGDSGIQASFDISKQINSHVYAGIFYDVGTVKLHTNPLTTDITNRTSLMGAGAQFGGNYERLNWSISLAKSFGSYDTDFPAGSITKLGSWYTYAQLSLAY